MIKAFLLVAVLVGGYWVYTHPNTVNIAPGFGIFPTKKAELQKQAQEISDKTQQAVVAGADKAKEYATQAREELTQTGKGVVKGAQVGIYDQAVAAAEKALSSVAKSLGLEDKETTQLGSASKPTNITVDVAPQEAQEMIQVCSVSAPGKQVEFGLKLAGAHQAVYTATIEWGDQTKATGVTLTAQKVETVTHAYQSTGTYTITIRAAAEGKEYISYKTLCVN